MSQQISLAAHFSGKAIHLHLGYPSRMTTSFPLMFDEAGNKPKQRATGSQLPSLVVDERKLLVFTQLWMQHQGSVQAYLASFLGNTAEVEDALQEVAMVVWQKGPWDGESSAFLGYCLGCARRIALATRRRQGADRLVMLSPEVASALADRVAFLEQQEEATSAERVLSLRRCLKKINPDQLALLQSRYSIESKDELRAFAKRSGKSMDALYKTLERLRELLRACVERSHHPTE